MYESHPYIFWGLIILFLAILGSIANSLKEMLDYIVNIDIDVADIKDRVSSIENDIDAISTWKKEPQESFLDQTD